VALADLLVFAELLARDTLAVSATAARRRRRRFLTACAVGIACSGVALATVASGTEELVYDEEAELGRRVREATGRFELPSGFQLAEASQLDPVDPLEATVFVDARGIHVGDQTFAPDDVPLPASCSVPMNVSIALAWEKRVARAIVAQTEDSWGGDKANLVIDARTPYRNVVAAWRWLVCERFRPALVFVDPRGTLGVVREEAFYRGHEVLVRVEVAPDGHRVRRTSTRERYPWRSSGTDDVVASYGADCTRGAEGASVSLQADDATLAECVLRALDDEAAHFDPIGAELEQLDREAAGLPPSPPPSREERRRRLYPTCGNSAALSYVVTATPDVHFRHVAHALLAARPVLSFAGFSTKP
jgi:hypothetical protein